MKIRVLYTEDIDSHTVEVLDAFTSDRGYSGSPRERIARMLKDHGRNEIYHVLTDYTCCDCGKALRRGDEGYGTGRGQCRSCIEKEDT